MPRHLILFFASIITVGAAVWVGAQERTPAPAAASTAVATAHGSAVSPRANAAARLEGEKRFRANCERCHAAPGKFPPRMMATIVRHMRVRANITGEDARLILNYMSQ
jgi:mono/diheme cytochrome c family protein